MRVLAPFNLLWLLLSLCLCACEHTGEEFPRDQRPSNPKENSTPAAEPGPTLNPPSRINATIDSDASAGLAEEGALTYKPEALPPTGEGRKAEQAGATDMDESVGVKSMPATTKESIQSKATKKLWNGR